MRRLLLMIGLAVCLTACTTGGGINAGYDAAAATERIDQAEQRYMQVKAVADIVLPFLPVSTQAKVRDAFGIVERAIATARIANSAAEQLEALSRAQNLTAAIERAATI